MVNIKFILIFLLIVGCKTNYIPVTSKDILSINLAGDSFSDTSSIYFTVSNLTNNLIQISDPSFSSNIFIDFTDSNGKFITKSIIKKVILTNRNKFILLRSRESKIVRYSDKLSELVNLEKNKKYSLIVQYEGYLLNVEKKREILKLSKSFNFFYTN